ncbi:hypothetical protein D3C87_1888350 [compost metagenome]
MYACTVLDMTTHGKIGFIGSDTKACSGLEASGTRTPAISITTDEWPAADTPIFFAPIKPLDVSTP